MSGIERGRSQVLRVEIDRSRCVLCGGPNDCALADRAEPGTGTAAAGDAPDLAAGEACWCVDRAFPQALTDRARDIDGGASCICRSCLAASA